MKISKKFLIIVLSFVFIFGLVGLNVANAATSPTLTDSANYSVLGATPSVTNTGASTTVGEVGVSPAASITGFPPGVAGGNNIIHLHSNDASAIAAQADNLSAFGFLDGTAGPTSVANADANCLDPLTGLPGTAVSGTDLAGLTLSPGLYCSAGTFLLTGNLNLIGGGGGNPWVFKMVSGLTTSAGSSVTVPVSNYACNVWWRVGSSATIGTTTDFKGNILALTSIVLQNSATLVGRAMAQTGTVTLDTNTITGCAAPLAPANLTLDKIMVGGLDHESDWNLTATGPTTFTGPGAVGATDVASDVPAGTYNLSESTGPSRYTASPWSCVINGGAPVPGSSLLLTWGDVAICTITNTYHAPTGVSGSSGTSSGTQPLIHLTKTPNPLALYTGAGTVTYTETITNPGTLTLSNVSLTDDKCTPVKYISGDVNKNLKLENTETWIYTCQTRITQTTTNTATATGEANSVVARDSAVATVAVSVPGLPRTGFPSNEENILWRIIVPAGILGLISVLVFMFFKRRKN